MLCERSQIQKAVILLILHSIKDKNYRNRKNYQWFPGAAGGNKN